MGANLDVGVLRSFLGEHSESVWSDTDLRNHLNLANLIVWKILSDQAPDLVAYLYTFTTDDENITFSNAVASVSSGVIDATSGSGIGIPVASVRAVYESKSPLVSTPSWRKIKVKTGGGLFPVFEGSNSIFNDLELPDLYQERIAIFDYGSQSLNIYPTLTKDMTYLVDLITETPIYIQDGAVTTRTRWITDSDTDAAGFLGVERFYPDDDGKSVAHHCHLAVIYEAAYQASFVDKSMRREFGAERDRLLALLATQHTISVDEAY